MLAKRSLSNRMALPQSSFEWEQFFARLTNKFMQVPLTFWQTLARVILVMILAMSLAKLFWLLFPSPKIPAAAVAISASNGPAATEGPSINIAQLKSLTVFGKAAPQEVKPVAPPIVDQAIDTRLNLILVGLISSEDEKSARAIIASGDKQEVYAIGDALPVGNGVTLSKVLSDKVIINNNGQYESLWLYPNDPSGRPITQVTAPQAAYVPPPMPRQAEPDRSMPMPSNPSMADVSRSLSDVIAMSIYREGDQIIGYRIRPGRDSEKFKSLGLQADDIVTSINGMPLNNPAKIMEVYKNMGNTTSANLEIRRGGSVITVDVVLQ